MDSFDDLARPVLEAVSKLSGRTYRDVDGDALIADLAERGIQIDQWEIADLMFALRDDQFLEWHRGGDHKFHMIRLGSRGRELVRSWPVAGASSTVAIEKLVELLVDRADDESLPEAERGKAGLAVAALREFSLAFTADLGLAWMKSVGLAP